MSDSGRDGRRTADDAMLPSLISTAMWHVFLPLQAEREATATQLAEVRQQAADAAAASERAGAAAAAQRAAAEAKALEAKAGELNTLRAQLERFTTRICKCVGWRRERFRSHIC